MRDTKEYTIWNAVTPVAVTSSTDASPAVVTATAHGFTSGQQVMINGHATNIAVNGTYQVVVLTANTFSLLNVNTGLAINGSGAGSGSGGVVVLAPKIPLLADFRNAVFEFVTSGSFSATVKIAGSVASGSSNPANFGATQNATNIYTFLQIINLDTGAAVNGATGITSAGTDLINKYEININAIKWVAPIVTAWSAGTITMRMFLAENT